MKNLQLLIILSTAVALICAPGFARELNSKSEKPWLDLNGPTINLAKTKAAGIVGFGTQLENHTFIIVHRTADAIDLPLNIDGVEGGEFVSVTGKASIQLGNSHLIKTFEVNGPLSTCVATSYNLRCMTQGRIDQVATN